MRKDRRMKRINLFAALALIVAGCAAQTGQVPAGSSHKRGQVISASYNPSVSGLPGNVGDIVTVAGGSTAWVKSGTGITAWTAFPGSGSAANVTAPITGDGSIGSPLGISAATSTAAGSMSATDKRFQLALGTTLPDASVTLQPQTDKTSKYILGTTLTADRSYTLNNVSVDTGEVLQIAIIIANLNGHQVLVKAADTSTIATIPANLAHNRGYQFYNSGGNWIYNTAWWID